MSKIPYSESHVNGSLMKEARCYTGGVAIIATFDGNTFVYSE